jgi:hypothetical protein
MKVETHYHFILLMVYCRREDDEESVKTQPTPTLRRSGKPISIGTRRRRRPRGMHQTRHPLFVMLQEERP